MWVGAFIVILKFGLGEFSIFLISLGSWCSSLLHALVQWGSLYTRGLRARRKEPSQWLVLACNSRYTWAFNLRARAFLLGFQHLGWCFDGSHVDRQVLGHIPKLLQEVAWECRELELLFCVPASPMGFRAFFGLSWILSCYIHSPLQISPWACLLYTCSNYWELEDWLSSQ